MFALRRLRRDNVLTVVASRIDDPVEDGWSRFANGDSRVTRIRLGGLRPGELIELASAVGLGSLSLRGAARLAAHTGGNALYCRALLDEIGVAGLNAAGEGGLPAPRGLSAVILARVAALSVSGQAFLGAASVVGQHAPVSTSASVAGLVDTRHEVDEAVGAGLLREGPLGELIFAHPLYRAAIYADLGAPRRRELHARAGELVSGLARLTHRVAASAGPDEALAVELESSAAASRAVGDAGTSAWAMEQAAVLSANGDKRERRLLDAAVGHLNAADTSAAAKVLASCAVQSARRDTLAGLLAVFMGAPSAVGCIPECPPRIEGQQQLAIRRGEPPLKRANVRLGVHVNLREQRLGDL